MLYRAIPEKHQAGGEGGGEVFHKIVLAPLEILRPKPKTPGNSTLFFLGHPRKYHFVFN